MKIYLSLLLAGVATATFATATSAMPAGDSPAINPGAHPMDCAKAKDKGRCEALNKDIESCKDKTGDAWRECMHQPAQTGQFTPPKPRDCSKARNKERCEAHNGALAACKDKTARAEHRKCMAEQLPQQSPASKKG